jgi:fructose-bisphosphate aldolase, class II
MFANTLKLLTKAQKGKYAIGHFNVNNMEIAQAVVQGAAVQKSPVILATSQGALKYAGLDYLFAIAKVAADSVKVPVAFHLDHGTDIDIIRKCIKKGYSSVMFDGSHLPYKKNVSMTKKIVNLAHRHGISVEAELGTIGGAEDEIKSRKIIYTDKVQAKEFVESTGCDILAVAIGTSHGAFKFSSKAHLRFDILQDIKKSIKTPLVLHGGSQVPKAFVTMAQKYGANLKGMRGVDPKSLQKAISLGITKINSDTDLRVAFDAGVRKIIKTKPKDFDPRHIVGSARDTMQQVVEHHIKLFKSAGKAK